MAIWASSPGHDLALCATNQISAGVYQPLEREQAAGFGRVA